VSAFEGGGKESSGSIISDVDYKDCFVLCPELIRITQNSRFGNCVNVLQTKQVRLRNTPSPPSPYEHLKSVFLMLTMENQFDLHALGRICCR